MDFTNDGNMNGGGNSGFLGLLAGSALNRRDDDSRHSYIWAIIIFAIIFIIALVFLAVFAKNDRREHVGGGDYSGLLATLVAAKSTDCNGNYHNDHEHIEIKDMISHSEDRREISAVKAEIGSLGLFMQKTASENEMKNLEQFGEIKAQLGMQSQAIAQVLQFQNNDAIINGVIQRLSMPCSAR